MPPAPALMLNIQFSVSHSCDNKHSISMLLTFFSRESIKPEISVEISLSLGDSDKSSKPVSEFSMAVLIS